jgi:hypothetical protein
MFSLPFLSFPFPFSLPMCLVLCNLTEEAKLTLLAIS